MGEERKEKEEEEGPYQGQRARALAAGAQFSSSSPPPSAAPFSGSALSHDGRTSEVHGCASGWVLDNRYPSKRTSADKNVVSGHAPLGIGQALVCAGRAETSPCPDNPAGSPPNPNLRQFILSLLPHYLS